MSVRRHPDSRADASLAPDAAAAAMSSGGGALERPDEAATRPPVVGPMSLAEAEARYVVARDAWTEAMRRCKSGRAVDLASLAIAQEVFELASAEVERWRSGAMIAISVGPAPETRRAGLEAAIGQEMAWRRVHEHQSKQPGPVGRLLRRLTRRG